MLKQSIQRLRFIVRKLTNKKLDVLDQLQEDHIRVEILFLQWRLSRSEASRRSIFEQIKHSLLLHARAEETLFYPACAQFPEFKGIIADGIEDHHHIKSLLHEISEISMDSDKANSKMKTLVKEVESHVAEEENHLFPHVRSKMKKNVFNRLGRELREYKHVREHKNAA